MDNELFETNTDFIKNYESIKKNYKTSKYLTKYEKTRVLMDRCQQLNNGSDSYLKNIQSTNIYEIAVEELNQKLIPFIIKRPLSNNFEYWKLEDLEII
mgnify:FL=1|tara:strand:+ start:195 stop:488 length:294 start_codon:yes stop_codon:yes gene_type:complete